MRLPGYDGNASDSRQLAVLAGLIRCQSPKVVVESGTYMGHGAVWMGSALRDTGSGFMWTADPIDHGAGKWIEANDLGSWVSYEQADFGDVVAGLHKIDFAYIDGSDMSRPDGADLRWRHFELAREKLSPGGIICVDDTAADDWSDGEGGGSVLRIRELCTNFTFCRGLSVYSP